MKELGFRVTGVVPLLIHCNRAANPLDVYAKYMKQLTAKRKKTDQDYEEIARVEWEAGLYLHDGIIALPADNLDRCLWDSAKRTKQGKQYKQGIMISEDWLPLNYKGPKIQIKQNGDIPIPGLDQYYQNYKHQSIVKVGMQQVLRTRPIFNEWGFEFTLMVDEQVFDDRTVVAIIEAAGKYIGLCEKRPRLGRFEAERIS